MTLLLAEPPDIVVSSTKIGRDPDEVYVNANDRQLSGWEEIEITLRAEGFPNSFHVALSSQDPIDGSDALPKEGTACTVLIGTDLVVTGYVDAVNEDVAPDAHTIVIEGRGKTQDLVDCSAEWDTGQLIQGTALDVAKKAALPYGIAVEMGPGASPGESVSGLALNYGETGAEIIQKFARNAGLLAYEDSRGYLILANVGTRKAAGGVVYGQNVERWSARNSMAERYSDIVVSAWSTNVEVADVTGADFYSHAPDPNVPRNRKLFVVAESVAADIMAFAKQHAQWEAARRAGRSKLIRAIVSGWRDDDGKLWEPNTLVHVQGPGGREAADLVISEVTFRRDLQTGTTAELTMMPPAAFMPEPIVIQPVAAADVKSPSQ